MLLIGWYVWTAAVSELPDNWTPREGQRRMRGFGHGNKG